MPSVSVALTSRASFFFLLHTCLCRLAVGYTIIVLQTTGWMPPPRVHLDPPSLREACPPATGDWKSVENIKNVYLRMFRGWRILESVVGRRAHIAPRLLCYYINRRYIGSAIPAQFAWPELP